MDFDTIMQIEDDRRTARDAETRNYLDVVSSIENALGVAQVKFLGYEEVCQKRAMLLTTAHGRHLVNLREIEKTALAAYIKAEEADKEQNEDISHTPSATGM